MNKVSNTGRFPFFGLLFGLMAGCTNLDLDPLKKRFDDNFNGTMASPSDLNPTGADTFSFCVVGDTHVGSPAGGVLRSIVRTCKDSGDAFVVVAGDLTDNGDTGQYRQFKQIFTEADLLYRVAIGNHDLFFEGWNHFKSEIGRSIY